MKKNKKLFSLLGICSLLLGGSLASYYTLAYQTDNEALTNTVTIGSIDAELKEPNWPGNNSNDVKNLVPNHVVKKDPEVENVGVNDFVTFLTVEVPVRNVTLVAPDGTKGTKQKQEIFYMQKTGTAMNVLANRFNTSDTGWVELTSKEKGANYSGTTRTYVFGYAKKLEGSTTHDGSPQTAANKITTTLFDQIQAKNILEKELINADATQQIKITSYSIQSSFIRFDDGTTPDTSGTITRANLEKIYDVYVAQNHSN